MIRAALLCLLSILPLCAAAQTPRPLQDLTTLASPATGDLTYVVDVSASNASRKLTLGALQSWLSIASSQISDVLPLAKGGTGSNLSDPGADRLLFWDDSAGAVTWLTAGSGLSISGTTITASGGGGGSAAWGDITGTLSAQTDLDTALDAKQAASASLSQLTTLYDPGVARLLGWNEAADSWALYDVPTSDGLSFNEGSNTLELSTNLAAFNGKTAPTGDVVGTSDTQTLTNKTLGTGTAIDLGSDATGDLYYRNSGGDLARLPIGSSGQVLTVATGLPSWQTGGEFFTTVYKASDTARNTTTTLTADPDLTFALATNTRYVIEFYLWFSTFQDPDFKYSVDNTATFSAGRATCRTSTPGSANPLNGGFADGVIGSTAVAGTFSGNQSGFVECTVAFVTSSTGTFTILWAQNTSNGSDTTMRAGSYIRYRAF